MNAQNKNPMGYEKGDRIATFFHTAGIGTRVEFGKVVRVTPTGQTVVTVGEVGRSIERRFNAYGRETGVDGLGWPGRARTIFKKGTDADHIKRCEAEQRSATLRGRFAAGVAGLREFDPVDDREKLLVALRNLTKLLGEGA
ncbi:hypothetical protein CPT_Sonora_065 [Stenotrophomonas phage Sonora]|nr:hypothetical protein CPT_Sonora_065 [Stenotrophomonas phage Sonora]